MDKSNREERASERVKEKELAAKNKTEKLLNFICTFPCACFVFWFVPLAEFLTQYSVLLLTHTSAFYRSSALLSLHCTFSTPNIIRFSSYFHLILGDCDPSLRAHTHIHTRTRIIYTCMPAIGMAADTYLYTYNTCMYVKCTLFPSLSLCLLTFLLPRSLSLSLYSSQFLFKK